MTFVLHIDIKYTNKQSMGRKGVGLAFPLKMYCNYMYACTMYTFKIQEECSFIHSFIHSGHFYSASSSPLLLRGAPDYSTDTVSEFHAEAHWQLQVKDLPKVPTWWPERESNQRPSG